MRRNPHLVKPPVSDIEDDNPIVPGVQQEILASYGLSPHHTDSHQVRILYENWQLDAAEIARITQIEKAVVEEEIEKIEEAISNAGKELTPEEKRRQRGMFIRRLEANLLTLQQAFNQNNEPSIARLINQTTERLVQLRSIDTKDPDAEVQLDIDGELAKAIKELPLEKIQELRARLEAL